MGNLVISNFYSSGVVAQLVFRFIRHILDVIVAKALGSAVPRLLVQMSGF